MNIIDLLLNEVNLHIGNQIAQIAEVEVYGYGDPINGNAIEQLSSYCWYFRRSNPDTKHLNFISGRGAGLEFTCGSLEYPGGILIRSIYVNNKIIEGPKRVVKYILNQTGHSEILPLLKLGFDYPQPSFDVNFYIHLKFHNRPRKFIYSGPRVGLVPTCPSDISRILKTRRFTTCPDEITIEKNLLALNFLITHPELKSTILTRFNTSSSILNRWVRYFNQGINLSVNEVPIPNNSKNICLRYGFFCKRTNIVDPLFSNMVQPSPDLTFNLLCDLFPKLALYSSPDLALDPTLDPFIDSSSDSMANPSHGLPSYPAVNYMSQPSGSPEQSTEDTISPLNLTNSLIDNSNYLW